jgi:hypothetical protein
VKNLKTLPSWKHSSTVSTAVTTGKIIIHYSAFIYAGFHNPHTFRLFNSHIVTIPPGPHILSEMLKSTPIAEGEDGALAGFASGSGDNEFGMDGGMDPELELVSWVYTLSCMYAMRPSSIHTSF